VIKAGQAPVMDATKRIRMTMIIHIELAAIVVIGLCAAIMASVDGSKAHSAKSHRTLICF
jgi:hypothetical protein